MEKEKIPLLVIYKKDGQIFAETPNEVDSLSYEIYGFLKCYVKKLGKDLTNDIVPIND